MTSRNLFERQNRWSGWVTGLTVLCSCAAIYATAAFFFGRLIGFVVCAPIVGAIVSYLFVNSVGAGFRWLRWLILHKLNGQYHAFDNVEVRIEWREGQCRVAAADAFNAMQVEQDQQSCRKLAARYGEHEFSQDAKGQWWFGETAIIRWLGYRLLRFDNRALRFRFWLERDVFRPMHRKMEIPGMPPVCPAPNVDSIPPPMGHAPQN